jgi:hypothetical protein
MFVMHSFVGYPITSFCLKREGARIMKDYRANGPGQREILSIIFLVFAGKWE